MTNNGAHNYGQNWTLLIICTFWYIKVIQSCVPRLPVLPSTHRVNEVHVEAVAQLLHPGCDLVKHDRFLPSIWNNHNHLRYSCHGGHQFTGQTFNYFILTSNIFFSKPSTVIWWGISSTLWLLGSLHTMQKHHPGPTLLTPQQHL